ncbi:MAG: SDR family oxidoreductase [Gammaproteobacteria bacterium]|nr:SDR family oxidoreductase [Gammaproteobacteria bacterium]
MSKLVLITGASKGIGRELAIVFARHHYSLILIARNLNELQVLQSELKEKYQCEAKILSLDLSEVSAVSTILSTFKAELPQLDILINNAGFGIAKKFTEISYQDVNEMIALNITALTDLTYQILTFMQAKKSGKILNVASTAAYTPGPYMSLYYASKAFVLSLSEGLYEEYKNDGIVVSTLCPGLTRTSFQSRAGMKNSVLVKGMFPGMTASQVAEIAYDDLEKNKSVIITGIFNKLSVLLMKLTPRFVGRKIMAKLNNETK